MIQEPTVLVLGAGASAPYGLPVGGRLCELILELDPDLVDRLPIGRGTSRQSGTGPSFQKAFRRSGTYSIDAFLAGREEFADIGRHAIAHTLLPRENLPALVDANPPDNWYRYLLQAMHAPWDEFHKNQISFITFNYDRSLEVYMLTTFQHRFGRSPEEAFDMLKRFKFIHVYGSLGSLDPQTDDFVPFGGADADLRTAAKGLQIMAEGRDDSPHFEAARAELAAAVRLAFLGFAFDPLNVRRLGGQSIRAASEDQRGGQFARKRFAATTFELKEAERRTAARSISWPEATPAVIDGMHDAKSLETLRITGILGPN